MNVLVIRFLNSFGIYFVVILLFGCNLSIVNFQFSILNLFSEGWARMNNRTAGYYGEQLAENFLKQQGYKVLERNFWCRYGEIDLIAQKGDYLSFIEVKSASSQDFIHPQEKVDSKKQKKIERVAQYYLQFREFRLDLRFDVVVVITSTPKPKIKLIKNSFWIEERV
jgi:putative endonuclease